MSWTLLSCGCGFGTVDDVFVYEACAPDCEYFLYVQRVGAERGLPSVTLDLRDDPR